MFVEDKPVITNTPTKHPVVRENNTRNVEVGRRSKHLISHVIFFLLKLHGVIFLLFADSK